MMSLLTQFPVVLLLKILGHFKQTRISGTIKFTELEKWYITPAKSKSYTKPLILLPDDQTPSGGDVLAMISKAIPNTTIIGVNTLGIYSEMYEFEQPSKWLMSNQKNLSSKMVCYKG